MALNIGREALKFLASLGSGTLTALGVGLLVEIGMDPTRPLGGAIAVAVGTGCVRFVGWWTARYGPKPLSS